MTVLRIIRHNDVTQTCSGTSSHPSLAACAHDVVTTVQQLKKRKKTCYQWLQAIKHKNIYIISPHKLALCLESLIRVGF